MLRRRGYRLSEARWAAHAAAVAGAFNWQGNPRLASILQVSTRTAQRARARLERDGLIKSYLLSPGDQLEGQRAPVRRHQVVRDVERLQRAARRRLEWLNRGRAHAAPSSAAHVPPASSTYDRGTPWRRVPQTPQELTPQERAPQERAPMPDELEQFLATGQLPPRSPRRAQRGGQAPPRGS